MGIKIETIQNRFEGGMINDIRNSIQARTGNTFIARPYGRVIKNFDILTAEGRMLPHYDDQADGSIGDTERLCMFLTYGTAQGGTKQYALGVVSGTDRAKIFERASLPQGVWGASTTGEVSTGTRSEKLFIEYKGVIYGAQGSEELWSYKISTNTINDSATLALGFSYTDIAQGIVHSKDGILYIPYDNKIIKKDDTGTAEASIDVTANWTLAALTLPTNVIITSICEYGNLLAAVTKPKFIGGRSFIYLWDRGADSPNNIVEKIDLGTNEPRYIQQVGEYLVVILVTSPTSVVKKPKFSLRYIIGSGTKKIAEFDTSNITILFGNNLQKQDEKFYFT